MIKYNPRYLPSLIGETDICNYCVTLRHADANIDPPLITWWNESYGLPMPFDHGIADYDAMY